MPAHAHTYRTTIAWEGDPAEGTRRYATYARAFQARIAGKPVLAGSADAAFRGDPARHNPEDLLLIALASCHMLSFLALCAHRGVDVLAYVDRAEATLATRPDGGGRFTDARLRPRVRLADAGQRALATELHEQAHRLCFIANSCNFPIALQPAFDTGDAPDGDAA